MRTSYIWSSLRSFARAGLVLLALCVALSSAKVLYAQASAGITGTVTDSSGAIVSGASVTITNQATSQARQTTTNSAGTYAVTGLTPGIYSVAVEAAVSRSRSRIRYTSRSAPTATINIALSTGSTSETVEVTAESIALNTTQPQLGSTIEPVVVGAARLKLQAAGARSTHCSSSLPGHRQHILPPYWRWRRLRTGDHLQRHSRSSAGDRRLHHELQSAL